MQEKISRYSAISITLHWLIAALIIANVFVGGAMEEATGPDKRDAFALHKSIGLSVLFFSLIRLGWRLTHAWPALPETLASWERWLARATHVLFYVLMIAIPLMGWAAASAGDAPALPLWGFIPAPNLPLPVSEGLSENFGGIHELLVKSIYVLLALHVAGALKHHILDKDIVLHRMLPILPPRK